MNKYGKGSGIFILLVPIFVIATLIIGDTLISYNQDKQFKRLTEDIIEDVANNEELYYDDYYDEIKRLYESHGYETEMLFVDVDNYKIYVENEHKYYGIFSSIFGSEKEELVKLFGVIDFKVKKGSKIVLKVEATFDENNELNFKYILE